MRLGSGEGSGERVPVQTGQLSECVCVCLFFGSCFETRSDPELMILLSHSLLSAGIISHLAELSLSKAHKVQGKPPWWKTLWGGGQGHGSVDTPGTGASFCGHQGLDGLLP